MDNIDHYDVILLGTGFVECVIGAILSLEGKQVLFIDRERFSGGPNGSVCSLSELKEKFSNQTLHSTTDADLCVDLIPKYFVGRDRMVQILQHVGIEVNMLTKNIQSHYLYDEEKLKPVKITEASRHVKNLVKLAKSYNISNQTMNTGESVQPLEDSIELLLKKFDVTSENDRKFVLQGLAGGSHMGNDHQLLDAINRFCDIPCYQSSAYHYPYYGLGELIQQLLKTSQKLGGRCMLNRPVSEIQKHRDGYVYVTARDIRARASVVIGDASYFRNRMQVQSKIVRGIAILDHPMPETINSKSCTIVLPRSLQSCDNIFLSVLGEQHCVAPPGVFIAYASTVVKTENPHDEIEAGLKLLGPALAKFTYVDNYYKPLTTDEVENIYISGNYDATPNWDSVCDDILRLYKNVTGKKFVMS